MSCTTPCFGYIWVFTELDSQGPGQLYHLTMVALVRACWYPELVWRGGEGSIPF